MKRIVFLSAVILAGMSVMGCEGNKNAEGNGTVIPVESVIIDKVVLEMQVGDTDILTATVLPETAESVVVWESADPKIASIDENGMVTAVAAGNTTVRAVAGAVSATCPVLVVDKAFVFEPEMAESAYAVNAFFNPDTEKAIMDEAVVWLRSADYTIKKGSEFGVIEKQTGKELQLSFNVALGSNRSIPEGEYELLIIGETPIDARKPMTSFAYYMADVFECGTVYSDYDADTKFIPVSGTLKVSKSGADYVFDVEMFDEAGGRFICNYTASGLEFKKDTFDKYLSY